MIAVKITADFKGQNALHPNKMFNKRASEDAERAALYESEQKAINMYRKTTRTWSSQPSWTAKRTRNGWTIYVSTKIFKYLDEGTAVRYATMTKDFKPKTRTGVFYSYAGAGKVAYVSKAVPRPGIRARDWTPKVDEEVGKIVRRIYRERLHTNWVNP